MDANTGPGWKKYPKHRITTKPAGVRVQIKFKGEVIADTRDAIQLEETHVGHVVAPGIYYIPRKVVKMERLNPASHVISFAVDSPAAHDPNFVAGLDAFGASRVPTTLPTACNVYPSLCRH